MPTACESLGLHWELCKGNRESLGFHLKRKISRSAEQRKTWALPNRKDESKLACGYIQVPAHNYKHSCEPCHRVYVLCGDAISSSHHGHHSCQQCYGGYVRAMPSHHDDHSCQQCPDGYVLSRDPIPSHHDDHSCQQCHHGDVLRRYTMSSLLQACVSMPDGYHAHAHLISSGLEQDTFLATLLVNVYGKCGALQQILTLLSKWIDPNVVSWNSTISTFVKHGHGKQALQLFWQMQSQGLKPTKVTFVSILRACDNLMTGRALHAIVIEGGLETDVDVASALIRMYGKFEAMLNACLVFDNLHQQDVLSWTSIISTCVQHGHNEKAIYLFQQMQLDDVEPSKATFSSILGACNSPVAVEEGMKIHKRIVEGGYESDMVVSTAIVRMYGKCRHNKEARYVFDNIVERNICLWNAMIAAYLEHGENKEALLLFRKLQLERIQPNKTTFVIVLQACANLETLADGEDIHTCTADSGFVSDVIVGTALVSMYGKCGALEKARGVFDSICLHDSASWNAMIRAYAQRGYQKDAVQLFEKMQLEGAKPNAITFVSVLNVYDGSENLADGRAIHALTVDAGVGSNPILVTALVSMYGKCGDLECAWILFNQMQACNVISWTAMISVLLLYGQGNTAFDLFQQMLHEGLKPNSVTLISVLGACDSFEDLDKGKCIHAYIVNNGFEVDPVVGTALVNMYGKCGVLDDSRAVFDSILDRNVITWNAMIAAYVQHGHGKEALQHFQQMQVEDIKPDNVTFVSILQACDKPADLMEGKSIHACITNSGFELDDAVMTALVNMYGKCGALKTARSLFDSIRRPNGVAWTTMISTYAQKMHGKEALQLFQEMQQAGVKPDEATFVSVLSACADLAALPEGEVIHHHIMNGGFDSHVVQTALVNMYSKCGILTKAQTLFDKMDAHDKVSWTAMITGYAQQGQAKEALKLFQEMEEQNVKPDEITFVGVLTACSRAGLVVEGRAFFNSMCYDYGISPSIEHYGCMVDLFGRAGLLDEAERFISKMPLKPHGLIWMTLLGACRLHSDVGRGELAAGHVMVLDPKNPAPFILLSNIYATAGRWTDMENLKRTMMERDIWIEAGWGTSTCTCNVDNTVHYFFAKHGSHLKPEEVQRELDFYFRHTEAEAYAGAT